MAKLADNIAAQIEQLTYSLPSFGDTFVENTNEGLKIIIEDADETTHEAYSEYFVFEGLTVEAKNDHILITSDNIDTSEGLTEQKLNNIHKYVVSKKDNELTNDFNNLIMPFLGDSYDKLEIADNKLSFVQSGLDTVLKAHGVNHDDFVVTEVMESTIAEVMPSARIGDVIEITTDQDVKDNFGKYVDQLGNFNDISLWLNNGGHIEVEIADTLADTINGITVDVRLIDGSSKLPNDKDLIMKIEKFFTDEDIKSHIGNKRLFEDISTKFGFEPLTEEYIQSNPNIMKTITSEEIDHGVMVAETDDGSLVYSPAAKMVKVYPTDDQPYVVAPVTNENDANRVLLAVNDGDNDSTILVDRFDEMGMTMVIEGNTNEEFTKDEIVSIIGAHNVSGTPITDADIDDDFVKDFNEKLKAFLGEYPDFEIFKDDYDGEEDDKFVELLTGILGSRNLSII